MPPSSATKHTKTPANWPRDSSTGYSYATSDINDRGGGGNAYTRYLPRENYSTKRETDFFFLPSSPGHGHGVSASYPNMFEPKDCVFRSTTNTHALSISAEWKMRQLYTFFVRIAFGVLIGGTILFLRRVELKMKFLF
jgi:hypothetical protein